MKTKEELNTIKEEAESLKRKLAALTDEELAYVAAGGSMKQKLLPNEIDINDIERYKLFIG